MSSPPIGVGVALLAGILAALHLPSVLLMLRTVAPFEIVFVIYAGPLQLLAFLVTLIALLSRSVRRSKTIWTVTLVGVIAFVSWAQMFGRIGR